jgi:mRNA-degrading endonuclease RelE of RelBE toxin-antitoxin system
MIILKLHNPSIIINVRCQIPLNPDKSNLNIEPLRSKKMEINSLNGTIVRMEKEKGFLLLEVTLLTLWRDGAIALDSQDRYRIVYSIQNNEFTVWAVEVGHRKNGSSNRKHKKPVSRYPRRIAGGTLP